MILRQHKTNESNTTALYSDCERYRYHWLRTTKAGQPQHPLYISRDVMPIDMESSDA